MLFKIRKIIFYVTLLIFTILMGAVLVPLFPATSIIRKTRTIWPRAALLLLKLICGVNWKVTGLENIPSGNFILASKHQSAFETAIFPVLFPSAVFVLKKELIRIPVVGTYLKKLGMIHVDRSQGKMAIYHLKKQLLVIRKDAVLVIFPEGTRTTAGVETFRYQPGVALIYETLKWPVLPVALDTGLFWPRTGSIYPGTATIKILKPINSEHLAPSAYDRKFFLHHLNKVIETESFNLYNKKHRAKI